MCLCVLTKRHSYMKRGLAGLNVHEFQMWNETEDSTTPDLPNGVESFTLFMQPLFGRECDPLLSTALKVVLFSFLYLVFHDSVFLWHWHGKFNNHAQSLFALIPRNTIAWISWLYMSNMTIYIPLMFLFTCSHTSSTLMNRKCPPHVLHLHLF